jgi:hypothetical protein
MTHRWLKRASSIETNREESNPPSTKQAREESLLRWRPQLHLQPIEPERRREFYERHRGMSLQERERKRVSDKKKDKAREIVRSY